MPLYVRIPMSRLKKTADENDKWTKYEEISKFIFNNMGYMTFDCYVSKEIPQTLESPMEPAEAVCEAEGEMDLKLVEDKFGKLDLDYLNDQGGAAWQEASELMGDLIDENPKDGYIFDHDNINYKFEIKGDKLRVHVDAEPKNASELKHDPEYDLTEKYEK